MQFRFRYLEKDIKAAGSLEINPELLKPGKKLYLEIADELPDLDEEIQSGYDKKFVSVSEIPLKGSMAFRIYHIAYNSRVILLTRKRDTNIGKIHNFLEDYVSIEDLTEIIVPLTEYPENWTASTENRGSHPISVIESVIKRLEDVEKLETEETDWGFPVAKSGLCLFILFTCIESLALSFIPYNGWLLSRRKKEELDDAIARYKSLPSHEFLAKVHNYYLDRYGMARSIKDFFNRLDPSLKTAFTNSIIIYENDLISNGPRNISSLDEAVDFLLDFRNSFSHGFVSKVNIPLLKEAEFMELDNYSGTVFMAHQEIYKNGSFRTVNTINLIGTMKLIVKHSLWTWIKHARA